ncbi:MAG TPA: DUF58 domain-containing protein [Polyangiaceae bacterium]|jgi:uncharacterized protein (DUF58 family)|nr:DUF58 domain-containing protein [Polyangiaceae bacterium]
MNILQWLKKSPSGKALQGAVSSSALFGDDFQRRLEMLALVSRRVFAGRMRAERRSKKKGSGIEFADHRDYVAGDDFRFIDWNIYQRFGKLLVRLYEEEEDLSIYLIVDCSGSMGFAAGKKFDQARRLAAALAYVGLANLDRVTVLAVGSKLSARLPTMRGKKGIFSVLRFLEARSSQGSTDLAEAMRTVVAQHKRRGLAILISDLYDPAGFEAGINVLRYNRFEPCVLHVVDPAEAHPQVRGDVHIVDCESGEGRDVTVSDSLLSRLAQGYADYLRSVERFCAQNQVPYFAADANAPFDELVLKVLRRGGFLR